jgi:hypothetical protein
MDFATSGCILGKLSDHIKLEQPILRLPKLTLT